MRRQWLAWVRDGLAWTITIAGLVTVVRTFDVSPRIRTITDYETFRRAGAIVLAGDPAGPYVAPFPYPYPYPPTTHPLIEAIARMPPTPGFALTVVIELALLVCSVLVLGRAFGLRHETVRGLVAVALLLPSWLGCLLIGHFGPTHLALISIVAWAWLRERSTVAGVALGILALEKPQLAVALVPLAALAGAWRLLAVAVGIGVVGMALTVAAYGVEPWIACADAVARLDDGANHHHLARIGLTLYAALHAGTGALGVSHRLAAAAWLLLVPPLVVAVVCAWRSWAMPEARPRCLGLAVLLTVVGGPHVLYYDGVLLLLPLAAWYAYEPRPPGGGLILGSIGAMYAGLVIGTTGTLAPVVSAPLIFAWAAREAFSLASLPADQRASSAPERVGVAAERT